MPKPIAKPAADVPDTPRDGQSAGQHQTERAPTQREKKQIDEEDHVDRRENLSDGLD